MNANDQFYRILRSIFLTTGHAAVTLCQIRRVVVFAHRDRALDSLATRYNNNPRLAYVGLFAFPITRNSRVFRSVPRCTDLLKQIMPWLFVGWTIVDVSIVGIRATRSQPRTSAAAKPRLVTYEFYCLPSLWRTLPRYRFPSALVSVPIRHADGWCYVCRFRSSLRGISNLPLFAAGRFACVCCALGEIDVCGIRGTRTTYTRRALNWNSSYCPRFAG